MTGMYELQRELRRVLAKYEERAQRAGARARVYRWSGGTEQAFDAGYALAYEQAFQLLAHAMSIRVGAEGEQE